MLRLIPDDEVMDHPIGTTGTSFRLRKLPHGKARALTVRHTRFGQLDAEAFDRAIWAHVLVGWSGLVDAQGVDVAFDPSRVWDVVQQLPHELAEVLLAAARRAELYVHEALGNSDPSSASGSARTETRSTD